MTSPPPMLKKERRLLWLKSFMELNDAWSEDLPDANVFGTWDQRAKLKRVYRRMVRYGMYTERRPATAMWSIRKLISELRGHEPIIGKCGTEKGVRALRKKAREEMRGNPDWRPPDRKVLWTTWVAGVVVSIRLPRNVMPLSTTGQEWVKIVRQDPLGK